MSFTILKKLPSGEDIIRSFPLSETAQKKVLRDREEVKNILAGKDNRLLLIVGPCSAWPNTAVLQYAEKLRALNEKVRDKIKIIMRVYIQKPRTTKGWTGPVNQPDPLGEPDIAAGIQYVREMMVQVIEMGLPIADEALFTHNAKGFLELLSWVAIGARSAEDQEHRIFASAIDCAVGLKNPTHGSLAIGVNSVVAAQHPHVAVFDGHEVQTSGNPYAHLVLRGADGHSNYSVADLETAASEMQRHGIQNPAIMIDVSHDNCIRNGKKDYRLQPSIIFEILEELKKNPVLKKCVKGFMVESFLKEGVQKIDGKTAADIDFGGLSITDPCFGMGPNGSAHFTIGGTMKPAVTVRLPEVSASHYPIFIQAGLLKEANVWLPDFQTFSQIAIITDSVVAKKYGTALKERICRDVACNVSKTVHLIQFPAGEKSKNNQTKEKIESELFRHRCDRKTLIIALGGGVVGDIAGFVAATYLRGVAYIQMPTTLLSMVDNSVGGKTGVDNAFGKNLIGAFWQPKAVVADLNCLKTLPKKQLVCGLVEAIKMFLTSDANSFAAIEKNVAMVLKGNEKYLKPVITAAVSIKAGVVRRDEKEQGERAILNCGHTIGHALERLSDYRLLHGMAVGLGILVEAKMSELMGILKPKDFLRIQKLLAKLGTHGKDLKKFKVDAVIKATMSDKKSNGGKVRYVLLKKTGAVCAEGGVFTHVVPERIIREAWCMLLASRKVSIFETR